MATRTTCFPSVEALVNPIAEVEVRAVVGSDEIETYMVEAAGNSARRP